MEKDNSGKSKPTILTCAQPTGVLTLGNYLGAVRNWSEMLDKHDCYFGIVDLHAITTFRACCSSPKCIPMCGPIHRMWTGSP